MGKKNFRNLAIPLQAALIAALISNMAWSLNNLYPVYVKSKSGAVVNKAPRHEEIWRSVGKALSSFTLGTRWR